MISSLTIVRPPSVGESGVLSGTEGEGKRLTGIVTLVALIRTVTLGGLFGSNVTEPALAICSRQDCRSKPPSRQLVCN